MKIFKKMLSLLFVTAIMIVANKTNEMVEVQALSEDGLHYTISEYAAHILNSKDTNINTSDADLNTDGEVNVMDMIRYKQSIIQSEQNTEVGTLKDIGIEDTTTYVVVNNNIPYFNIMDKGRKKSFEEYSSLDGLGRCGTAFACIGEDIKPKYTTNYTPYIYRVKPTGWRAVTTDTASKEYLYNRCHLLGCQLTTAYTDERNIITGTAQLKEEMFPFEMQINKYIRETSGHVLYRVTPLFEGEEMLAKGVLLEALSVEDNGASVCFNVFLPNAQQGVVINYTTGECKVLKLANRTGKINTEDEDEVIMNIANHEVTVGDYMLVLNSILNDNDANTGIDFDTLNDKTLSRLYTWYATFVLAEENSVILEKDDIAAAVQITTDMTIIKYSQKLDTFTYELISEYLSSCEYSWAYRRSPVFYLMQCKFYNGYYGINIEDASLSTQNDYYIKGYTAKTTMPISFKTNYYYFRDTLKERYNF